MQLNLDLDYVVDEDDRRNPNFQNNSLISITLLRTAVNIVKGAEGKGHKDRSAVRVAGKVFNKITKAKNTKANAAEFDQLELLHIRDLFKEWLNTGVAGPLSGWFELLFSAIEDLVDKAEKEKTEKEQVKTEK